MWKLAFGPAAAMRFGGTVVTVWRLSDAAADVPVVLRGRGALQTYITVAVNFMTARKAAATG
jgi:hypothetical protein